MNYEPYLFVHKTHIFHKKKNYSHFKSIQTEVIMRPCQKVTMHSHRVPISQLVRRQQEINKFDSVPQLRPQQIAITPEAGKNLKEGLKKNQVPFSNNRHNKKQPNM